jgi:hypothetical protein
MAVLSRPRNRKPDFSRGAVRTPRPTFPIIGRISSKHWKPSFCHLLRVFRSPIVASLPSPSASPLHVSAVFDRGLREWTSIGTGKFFDGMNRVDGMMGRAVPVSRRAGSP